MSKKFTYEHWEAQDEYVILFDGPIGATVTKKEAETITRWLNNHKKELATRLLQEQITQIVRDSITEGLSEDPMGN